MVDREWRVSERQKKMESVFMSNRKLSSFPSHGAGVVVRGHGRKASTSIRSAGGPGELLLEEFLVLWGALLLR